MTSSEPRESSDFIRSRIAEDVAAGHNGARVHTRFPPEPNGFLHVGHAKAICINFGIAEEYDQGLCNLRFDDTNPAKEDTKYVEGIQEDIRWLGFDWGDRMYFASDYFEKLYQYAEQLIRSGDAYVDSQTADEIKASRGTATEPGKNSPWRDRSVDENLDLFGRMKAGEFEDGACVLRAKIDMASPNFNMRDPTIYRIRHETHHRTGDQWCIYPMYDFAHGLSDAIEGITHSLCSLEFENHRPLYDWFLEKLAIDPRPQQIEFAKLNLDHTLLSKRNLLKLVEKGVVDGWDDPRMPTLRGIRRRGVSPEALRALCEKVGVAKYNSVIELSLLDHCIREDLNKTSPRVMGVLDPLKVVIENYPEGQVEEMDAVNNPEDESAGTRKVPFSRELYIERDDFREEAPRKFHRLAPDREVRLRYAYIVKLSKVVKDPETGEVTEIHCTYDPDTRGGSTPDGRKVKGTIHWVSAEHALEAEVRLYDRMWLEPNPAAAEDLEAILNPDSLTVLPSCRLEPSLAQAAPGARFQFERKGYFCVDTKDSRPGAPVFNRTVPLRDSWAKIEKKGG